MASGQNPFSVVDLVFWDVILLFQDVIGWKLWKKALHPQFYVFVLFWFFCCSFSFGPAVSLICLGKRANPRTDKMAVWPVQDISPDSV